MLGQFFKDCPNGGQLRVAHRARPEHKGPSCTKYSCSERAGPCTEHVGLVEYVKAEKLLLQLNKVKSVQDNNNDNGNPYTPFELITDSPGLMIVQLVYNDFKAATATNEDEGWHCAIL